LEHPFVAVIQVGAGTVTVPTKRKKSSKSSQSKGGERLFDQVIKLTGLPANAVKKELKILLDKKNIDVNNLTLEQLRAVVASYLREIMIGILERSQSKSKNERHH